MIFVPLNPSFIKFLLFDSKIMNLPLNLKTVQKYLRILNLKKKIVLKRIFLKLKPQKANFT